MALILVTGVSSRLGRDTAKTLADDGHDVVGHARNASRLRDTDASRWKGTVLGDLAVIDEVGDVARQAAECRLPLSTTTVTYLADLLRSRLKAIGSRWRIRPPGRIAVLVLAILRHDQRAADLAGANDIAESTLRRWREELIALLAAKAPRLDRALRKIANRGGEVVLIDGTLIPTRRRTGRDNRPNYSGKHHRHGLHFLALTDDRGRLIWIAAAGPGRTHDATAARHDKIVEPRTCGIPRPRRPWLHATDLHPHAS